MPIQRSHIDDYTPDGRYANWLIEVFPGSSLRDLRLAVLQLAYRLSQEDAQDLRGMVVLVDSRIRPSSVNNEMRRLRAVLLPDLVDRLVIYNEADALAGALRSYDAPPELLTQKFNDYLKSLITSEASALRPYGTAPGSGKDVVLEFLILSWLRADGPISAAELQRQVGVSYPTAAAVIKELEASGELRRGYNRSVELARFPWAEWRGWLARTVANRKTVLYRSVTNLPRPPVWTYSRLERLERDDIGVGGTLGATKHFPKFDIVGTPRVDLVVLGEPKDLGDSEVARIDPSLERFKGRAAEATVVVHFVGRRKTSPFTLENNVRYADPLNCMADLYDVGLENQANEMLRHLVDQRSTSPAKVPTS
ncbi:MAG: winged helix-turn-helix transcriptional regulator [Burkholderiales bacterium]|jgi:hypothetical protein|nr:winged helix-turn-helix transcriptional regulator [Burkholderiales bacterium]MCZ8293778.1 winged helix-turn-helix transcriptional regulator [Hylemonella sp.]MDZ4073713.1 winged helix-turn-helix transcriptional regulator [Hylemonella sp.]